MPLAMTLNDLKVISAV